MAEQTQLSVAVVYVGDLDVSVNFYSDVLGLKVTDRDATAALLAEEGRSPLILRAMGQDAARAAPDRLPLRELPARIYAW